MQCTKLEELTLDNNVIHSTEGIGKLHSLKWLSLSSNQLSELSDDLWTLSKLHYLNISHNSISNLHHLKVIIANFKAHSLKPLCEGFDFSDGALYQC